MIAVFLIIDMDDGIVEGGFLGIVDHLFDLLVIPTDTLEHRLLVILQADTIKRGCLMGRVIGQKKRVCSLSLLVHKSKF